MMVGDAVRQRGGFGVESHGVHGVIPYARCSCQVPAGTRRGPVPGGDPGALLGVDGQHPGAYVDELVILMVMAVNDRATVVMMQDLAGVRLEAVDAFLMLADLRHQ